MRDSNRRSQRNAKIRDCRSRFRGRLFQEFLDLDRRSFETVVAFGNMSTMSFA